LIVALKYVTIWSYGIVHATNKLTWSVCILPKYFIT
jgi:hypothetical protein